MNNDLKYTLFENTKSAADRLLKAARNSDSFYFELARRDYVSLYDVIRESDLESEYESWDWYGEDEEEA